jgi:2-oxoglutarate dehydrogenase E1 component
MKIEDLTPEQRQKLAEFGVNTWFVMELLEDYLNNPGSVGEDWQQLFSSLNIKTNGKESTVQTAEVKQQAGSYESYPSQPQVNLPKLQEGEEAVLIRGAGERVIENMTSSLTIPIATSFRAVLKSSRREQIIINQHLKKIKKERYLYSYHRLRNGKST